MKLSRLAAICAMAAAASTAMAADNVTLKIAHFLPAASNAQANVIEPWCAKLKTESEGRINCQIYPSMQLGGTPAQLADMARNGVADIVWTAPAYSAGKFPTLEVLELPFMLPYGGEKGNELIWKFYQEHGTDDFKDYKVLAMFGDGGMDIHSRPRAVRTLEDFKGLKLRASSRTVARTLEALGATPVSMPPAQMTEAISKGVVDGALGAWEVVPSTKLEEVTRYHSAIAEGEPAIGYTVLSMLMNKRKYDQMPADLKEILDRNSGDALVNDFGVAWDEATRKAKELVTAEQIIAIEPADYEAMRKATDAVGQEWVVDYNKRGKKDGAELFEAARGLLAQ